MTHVDTAPERTTRRDLVEGKVEKVLGPGTEMVKLDRRVGGLQFANAMEMAEAAKIMSTAGPMLPPWLQGNVGGCWAVILRAHELDVSPLNLAAMTYVVDNKGVQQVAYMSNFYHSIIEARAPITTRLNWRYEGEGDARKCFVFATFRGETTPREWPPQDSGDEFTLGKLRPGLNQYGNVKGSPLWQSKPDLQLFYAMARDWARVYIPELLAGIYARDDFPDAEEVRVVSPSIAARDTSPGLAARLRGPGGDGFAGAGIGKHVDETIDTARVSDEKKSPIVDQPVGDAGPAAIAPSGAAGPEQSGVASAAVTAEATPDAVAAGVEADTPPVAAAHSEDDPLAIARKRGIADFGRGLKKRAVPMEYRDAERTAEARAWMDGWEIMAEGDPKPGGEA